MEITHQDYMWLVEWIEKLEGKVEALSKYVDKQLQEKYFGTYEEGRNWAIPQNITFADHVHPRSSAYGPYNSNNLIARASSSVVELESGEKAQIETTHQFSTSELDMLPTCKSYMS